MQTTTPQLAETIGALGLGAADTGAALEVATGPAWAMLIPMLPLLGAAIMGVCAIMGVRSKLPAWITVGLLGFSAVLAAAMYAWLPENGRAVSVAWEWINVSWGDEPGQTLKANFGFYIDSLTCLWMLFVTLLATLIALYASEYMSHDLGAGYCRFFAAFNLFVFSMACLVMGDNLLLLFLGWEGVGLCSYLLIGYHYKKHSAVFAAKKAFIVNRIGDLGLLLGVFLTFVHFGTLEYKDLFPMVQPYIEAMRQGAVGDIPAVVQLIPVLLMIGAFGKSAQLPLFVWLPDAMEGPTPVSALIHAATMVTAGVYLIARMYPLFLVSEWALPIVAWVGGLTALVAATIAMAQFDIKRIMAYSTVSQLGFMFCGLAFLSSVGGAFHVVTHAFFKATLFLCCGAVMHGFAGQLDLRKLSGVSFMKGWGIVGIAMFIGCLNLAGFPFTAGYFSKDMILAEAFITPGPGYQFLGVILLLTAGITAYYTFRVFFRVFVGPKQFEPGDELHGHDGHIDDHHEEHGSASRATEADEGHTPGDHEPMGGSVEERGKKTHEHPEHFHPHAPGWAINGVLATLAILSVLAAALYFFPGADKSHKGWAGGMISGSSAALVVGGEADHPTRLAAFVGAEPEQGTLFGQDPHKIMYYVSGVIGFVGIAIAFALHYAGRKESERSAANNLLQVKPIRTAHRWANAKWYVDELYDFALRKPLWAASQIFHLIDKLLIDGLVNLVGYLPRALGKGVRPSQSGVLHSYAAAMAGGLAVILLIVLLLSL
ncbi:MAG: NADH-quinone oxidoreductase subunit L [Phycisphaerales bacterium]|nr:NADH-quinone oxidoreductase subunit L [Phycisphaerales bacterium]